MPDVLGCLCRDSDEDTDDEGPVKPVPDWARGKQLLSQLTAQVRTDPDEIFQQHLKTCTLDDVFKHGSGGFKHSLLPQVPDCERRPLSCSPAGFAACLDAYVGAAEHRFCLARQSALQGCPAQIDSALAHACAWQPLLFSLLKLRLLWPHAFARQPLLFGPEGQDLPARLNTNRPGLLAETCLSLSLSLLCCVGRDKYGNKKDLSRRGSSGNWIEDRVTWKEELAYKKAMGFL